ncbi:MAG: FkbM family methyltransferase [Planctomycetota bacterium]
MSIVPCSWPCHGWQRCTLVGNALLGRWFGRTALERDINGILYRALTRRYKSGELRLDGFRISYRDPWTFYIEAFYVWCRQVYHFQLENPSPYILDCGSSIGVSVLYFKNRYPLSHIVAFEPEPNQFDVLVKNLERNAVTKNVEVVQVALGEEDGEVEFLLSRSHGGRIVQHSNEGSGGHSLGHVSVKMRRLSHWINQDVDILKMNIEGGECEVLGEIEPQIHRVKNIVIEYHYIPGRPSRLHEILSLLHRNGFFYGLNHFDHMLNPTLQSPETLSDRKKYYLLVFAKRFDQR